MKALIDTDVLSEARKPDGHAIVKQRLAAADPGDLFIGAVSIGEVAHGIAREPAGASRRELEAWSGVTERRFADRVLPIGRSIAQMWGEIAAKAASAGRTLHAADGLVAATAIHHGLRIMARNVVDYEATGRLLVNPWAAWSPALASRRARKSPRPTVATRPLTTPPSRRSRPGSSRSARRSGSTPGSRDR
jgi:predicted nucleic acid-binding protein